MYKQVVDMIWPVLGSKNGITILKCKANFRMHQTSFNCFKTESILYFYAFDKML